MNKKEIEKTEKVKKQKLNKGKIATKIIAFSMVVIMVLGFAATVIFYLLNS